MDFNQLARIKIATDIFIACLSLINMLSSGMQITHRMEQFSSAYVRAIASVVGCVISKPEYDEDSVDFSLSRRGKHGYIYSPNVDVQLKCSYSVPVENGHIKFPLSIKNYNELRSVNVSNPRILILVIIPRDIDQWLDHNEQRLVLHHCGYWTTLRGLPETNNTTSVTIDIPQNQTFSTFALKTIMDKVGNEECL